MESCSKIIENIIQTLSMRGESITFAESCTGGQIAAELTAVSGASAVFNGAVVTYSNEIKHQWLGVSSDTLEKYGAVSSQCVREMLSGVLLMADADHAVAVSGIAGPTGGTPDKPVGTVYIGIKTPYGEEIYHNLFDGDREAVQKQSVCFAIEKFAEIAKI
jgi:nicotinamide-nucleotide amidase